MKTETKQTNVTVQTTVKATAQKVWNTWNEPSHIIQWNTASPDWHTPRAENDLRSGGNFRHRMEARDGSTGFDFEGTYDKVEPFSLIEYTISDGRKVRTVFESNGNSTIIRQSFDTETENSIETQRSGWQA